MRPADLPSRARRSTVPGRWPGSPGWPAGAGSIPPTLTVGAATAALPAQPAGIRWSASRLGTGNAHLAAPRSPAATPRSLLVSESGAYLNRRLAGSTSCQHSGNRPDQDLPVERQGPVVDVLHVHPHP